MFCALSVSTPGLQKSSRPLDITNWVTNRLRFDVYGHRMGLDPPENSENVPTYIQVGGRPSHLYTGSR